ncbi:MAG: T9SS type A sorting domain-containing protein [Bacteroidales bacterium]
MSRRFSNCYICILSDIKNSAIEADKLYNHTGINESSLNSAVQLSDIYPNPSNGNAFVNLYLPSSMVVDLSLFDQEGKKLQTIVYAEFTQGKHTLNIPTKDLISGIYHLRLVCGNIVLSKDVTIIK